MGGYHSLEVRTRDVLLLLRGKACVLKPGIGRQKTIAQSAPIRVFPIVQEKKRKEKLYMTVALLLLVEKSLFGEISVL